MQSLTKLVLILTVGWADTRTGEVGRGEDNEAQRLFPHAADVRKNRQGGRESRRDQSATRLLEPGAIGSSPAAEGAKNKGTGGVGGTSLLLGLPGLCKDIDNRAPI